MMHTSISRLTTHGRKTGFAALVVLTTTAVRSQTPMYWSQYSQYNPAMTGLLNRHEGWLSAGSAFNGYGFGASAGYALKIDALRGAVGVNYSGQYYGTGSQNRINVNYSHHLRLGENSQLALGASVGVIRQQDFSKTGAALNAGFGIAYRYKQLTAGVSVQNAFQPRIQTGNFTQTYGRTYTFFADHNWTISDRLTLHSSLLAVTSGNRFDGAIGTLRAIFDDRWWVGVSPSTDGFALSAGYNFKNGIGVGYSYTTGYNQPFRGGSHGLTVSFRLPDNHQRKKPARGL